MCVGIPMKLTEIRGDVGLVEEAGVSREIGLTLLEGPRVGDYVIVHAGYAIQLLNPEEAQETLNLLRQAGILPADPAGDGDDRPGDRGRGPGAGP